MRHTLDPVTRQDSEASNASSSDNLQVGSAASNDNFSTGAAQVTQAISRQSSEVDGVQFAQLYRPAFDFDDWASLV